MKMSLLKLFCHEDWAGLGHLHDLRLGLGEIVEDAVGVNYDVVTVSAVFSFEVDPWFRHRLFEPIQLLVEQQASMRHRC